MILRQISCGRCAGNGTHITGSPTEGHLQLETTGTPTENLHTGTHLLSEVTHTGMGGATGPVAAAHAAAIMSRSYQCSAA